MLDRDLLAQQYRQRDENASTTGPVTLTITRTLLEAAFPGMTITHFTLQGFTISAPSSVGTSTVNWSLEQPASTIFADGQMAFESPPQEYHRRFTVDDGDIVLSASQGTSGDLDLTVWGYVT